MKDAEGVKLLSLENEFFEYFDMRHYRIIKKGTSKCPSPIIIINN